MRYLRLLAVIVFLVVLVTFPYPGQTRQAAAPAEPVAMATSKRFDVSATHATEGTVARVTTRTERVTAEDRRLASKMHLLPEAFDR